MNFPLFGEMDFVYTSMNYVDYGTSGQFYGVIEGHFNAELLRASLHLTNLATKRPDDVNTPTLRGLLTTEDGAAIYATMDGIALAGPMSTAAFNVRRFVTSMTMRSGDPRYVWVNRIFLVVEGLLQGEPVPHKLGAHCRIYRCDPTIGDQGERR